MPDRSTQYTGGNTPSSSGTTSLDADNDCPDCTPTEHTYRTTLGRQRLAERARRELVLGSIRASLNEEPSPSSVRKRARMWCSDIRNLADDINGGTT